MHSMLGPGNQYVTVDLNIKRLRPVPYNTVVITEASVIHCFSGVGASRGELKTLDGVILAQASAT